jgi:AraC-like DNA-binding protein
MSFASSAQSDFNKSFDELIKKCLEAKDIQEKETYLKIFIEKTKREKDTSQLIKGHHIAALRVYKGDKKVKHSDSIIFLSKINPNKYYPVSGYILRGSHFYNHFNFKKALDNYLLANKYARLYPNESLLLQSNYYVGILKHKIGLHEEALELHSENYQKIKRDRSTIRDEDYLTYMFALANSFNELKQLDSASYYNKLGVQESKRMNNESNYFHFVLNEGVTQYHEQRYLRSLDSILKATTYFENIEDKQNSAVGYFYAGKSYLQLDKGNKALHMFKKVDTVFIEDTYILPKLRETYEILINHYKEKADVNKQLAYISRLIALDSVLYNDEIYLNKKIAAEYDTQQLLIEKERIIGKLQDNKKESFTIIYLLSALLIGAVGVVYYQYKKRITYKARFNQLLSKEAQIVQEAPTNNKSSTLNISSKIVNEILKNLQNFEDTQGYLKPGTNLNDLAKSMNTNANYLSKVVNYFKKESFINYLNGLRINYTISQLKSNHTFRRYTIKAIAKDVGFNNTQSFSKAFVNKTGIMPSYFIRELEKSATYS